MSGRRNHSRFAVTPPAEGAVRIPRDVVVHTDGGNDLVVLSAVPGVLDEVLTFELADGGGGSRLRVRVAASHPVMVEGVVRHRVRLRIVAPGSPADERHHGVARRLLQARVETDHA